MSAGIDRQATPTDRSNPNHRPNEPPHDASSRRPCSTWQPSQCFGTKRGVITNQPSIMMANPPASHHRQVQPGLRLQ
ncbi:DUF1589 domain-containing protein [Rhodopirellula islandica]|uniref:DUF1589 domain-containing protein n=1 Tax=Rhodopirellula islandica TaxID=595434 RepID=UPI0036F3EE72